ncbi:hypothetical protein [Rickettsia massiliae]|uniref:hypothetical protein n=1 Tax=Rickettsia massiliae TaxID=35791 RepID=UPI0002FB4D19|nr:hypothetical protein [Rickettsia massiliae]
MEEGANIIGEGDANLVGMERKKDKINQINSLKISIGNYEDKKDLLEKERQAKIDTKALEEFLTIPPKIAQLSEGQLREHFNVTRAKVAARPEFAPPAEKTNFEKVKSAVKAGVGYFVESQFGDLKEIYGKKEEISQSFITPNVSNKVKPEQNTAHEQAQHMQENLSHGKGGRRYGASSHHHHNQHRMLLNAMNLQEDFNC